MFVVVVLGLVCVLILLCDWLIVGVVIVGFWLIYVVVYVMLCYCDLVVLLLIVLVVCWVWFIVFWILI